MTEPTLSRRSWLGRLFFWGAIGTTLASAGGILVDMWLAAGRFSPAHWTELARLGDLPAEGTIPFPELRTALILRRGRVAALSLVCTHLGCLVNRAGPGFVCPCHGSRFGPLGEVYTGPAIRPLPWYRLELRGASLWLHTGQPLERPLWLELQKQERET